MPNVEIVVSSSGARAAVLGRRVVTFQDASQEVARLQRRLESMREPLGAQEALAAHQAQLRRQADALEARAKRLRESASKIGEQAAQFEKRAQRQQAGHVQARQRVAAQLAEWQGLAVALGSTPPAEPAEKSGKR